MNRADQAPEPSIEELLASIRLIISDADKQAPFQKEPRALVGQAGGASAYGAPAEVSADEVFDLTDELVFPEELGRPQLAPPQTGMRGQPGPDGYPGPQAYPSARRGGALQPSEGAPLQPPSRPGQERPEPGYAVRPEVRKLAEGPVSRPMWSRREPPADAAQAPAGHRQDLSPARPQARNWSGDIQMPVSEHGPVPLFPTEPGRGQPESAGADAASGAHEDAKAGPEAPQGEGEGSAAVAALAQRLARSAIGVLEASELENAQEVDFEHLDAESKAQVTERFADAIEVVAHAVQDEVSHPEIVEAQVPQPAPQQQPAVEIEVEVALAPATEVQPEVIAEVAVKTEAPAEAEAKVEARAEPEAEKAAAEPVAAPTPTPAEPVRLESAGQMAPGQPSVATATVAMQPPAQAQFMGAAQQLVPSQGGGALENVVREMLRPLLVQWLNENMPRVLENAIREEIAMRGLLPKSDS